MSELIVIVALGVIALGAVTYPLLAGHARYPDRTALEADLARYREAVHADTVCPRCVAANPAGSRFCAECGRELEPDPANAAEPTR